MDNSVCIDRRYIYIISTHERTGRTCTLDVRLTTTTISADLYTINVKSLTARKTTPTKLLHAAILGNAVHCHPMSTWLPIHTHRD